MVTFLFMQETEECEADAVDEESTPTSPQRFLSQEQILDDFCAMNDEILQETISAAPSSRPQDGCHRVMEQHGKY